MRVGRIREGKVDGVPVLFVDVDGQRSVLGPDQKQTILEKYGAVFLGAEFEDAYQVTIPADEADGQPEATLYGFTTDERVVEPYREFLAGLR